MKKELEAMQIAGAAVDALRPEARLRVARWLVSYVTDSAPPPARSLTDKWQAVMSAMAEAGGSGDYDAIIRWAREAGHSLTRAQARAQLHNYVKCGWVTALDGGIFEITPAGRVAATAS